MRLAMLTNGGLKWATLAVLISVVVWGSTLTPSQSQENDPGVQNPAEWTETYVRFCRHLLIDPYDWKVWEEYLAFLSESSQEERLTLEGARFVEIYLRKGQGYLPARELLERLAGLFQERGFALENKAVRDILSFAARETPGLERTVGFPLCLDLTSFRTGLTEQLIGSVFRQNWERAGRAAGWLSQAGPLPVIAQVFVDKTLMISRQEEDFLALGWIFSQNDFRQFGENREKFLKAYPRFPASEILRKPHFDILERLADPAALTEARKRIVGDFRQAWKNAGSEDSSLTDFLWIRRLVFWGLADVTETNRFSQLSLNVARFKPASAGLLQQAEQLFRGELYWDFLALLREHPEMWEQPGWAGKLAERQLISRYRTGSTRLDDLTHLAGEALLIVPESFWIPFFHMDRALRDSDFLVAEYWFRRAERFHPLHELLVMPRRALWVWSHRWQILPALFLFTYLWAKLAVLLCISAWKQSFWIRMALVQHLRPRLAMRLLERAIGTFPDTAQSARLFEMLLVCAQQAGELKKAERYAEILLAYRPGNFQHERSLTDVVVQRAQRGQRHALEKCVQLAQNPNDTVAMEKLVHSLLPGKVPSREFFHILKRYVALRPDDFAAVNAYFEVFRSSPPDMIPFDDVKLLEWLWEKNPDKGWGWFVWRIWMIRGEKGNARQLLEKLKQKGMEGPIRELFDQLERASEKVFQEIRTGLRSGENPLVLGAFERITRVKYWSPLQQQVLLKAVENGKFEPEEKMLQARQKALFSLKMGVPEWTSFFQWVDLNFAMKLET